MENSINHINVPKITDFVPFSKLYTSTLEASYGDLIL